MGNTNGKTLRDSNGRPPQALTSMPANTRGGMMGTLNAVHSDQVEVPPTPTSIIDATGKVRIIIFDTEAQTSSVMA